MGRRFLGRRGSLPLCECFRAASAMSCVRALTPSRPTGIRYTLRDLVANRVSIEVWGPSPTHRSEYGDGNAEDYLGAVSDLTWRASVSQKGARRGLARARKVMDPWRRERGSKVPREWVGAAVGRERPERTELQVSGHPQLVRRLGPSSGGVSLDREDVCADFESGSAAHVEPEAWPRGASGMSGASIATTPSTPSTSRLLVGMPGSGCRSSCGASPCRVRIPKPPRPDSAGISGNMWRGRIGGWGGSGACEGRRESRAESQPRRSQGSRPQRWACRYAQRGPRRLHSGRTALCLRFPAEFAVGGAALPGAGRGENGHPGMQCTSP